LSWHHPRRGHKWRARPRKSSNNSSEELPWQRSKSKPSSNGLTSWRRHSRVLHPPSSSSSSSSLPLPVPRHHPFCFLGGRPRRVSDWASCKGQQPPPHNEGNGGGGGGGGEVRRQRKGRAGMDPPPVGPCPLPPLTFSAGNPSAEGFGGDPRGGAASCRAHHQAKG